MSAKVKGVLAKMEAFNYESFVFYTEVEQLLVDYPDFVFNDQVRGTTDVFHDLEKKATPHGVKNLLKYDINLVLPLIRIELERLLAYRNALIRILAVIPAANNKSLVLSVLEHLFNTELNTGGGVKPAVQRVIKLYETEGKITKKRKADEKEQGVAVVATAAAAAAVITAAAEETPAIVCDSLAATSVDSVSDSVTVVSLDTQISSSSSSSSSSASSSSSSSSLPLARADSSDHIAQKAKWETYDEDMWWDSNEQRILQEFDIAVEIDTKVLAVNGIAAGMGDGDVIPGDFDLFSEDDFRQDGVNNEQPQAQLQSQPVSA